jgi:hypothetical protein
MASKFPADWSINCGQTFVKKLVPKFHLPAHIEKCQVNFSFNYTKGVGRTDGEAPERGWSKINGLAASAREMGPGSRRDTLEDHMGDSNWKKVVGMGKYYSSARDKSSDATRIQVSLFCGRLRRLFRSGLSTHITSNNS